MHKTRIAGAVAVLLVLAQSPLIGQVSTQRQPSLALPILGGLLAAGAGFFGGALIGIAAECDGLCDNSDDLEGLEGAIIGAIVGETLLFPVGVHLGNGRHGNFALDLGTAVGITGASLAAGYATGEGGIVILGVLAQMIGTVAVERATGRARMDQRAIRISVLPTPNGTAIGASVAF